MSYRFSCTRQPNVRVSQLACATAVHLAVLSLFVGSKPASFTSEPRATGERIEFADITFMTDEPSHKVVVQRKRHSPPAPTREKAEGITLLPSGPEIAPIALDASLEVDHFLDTLYAASTMDPGLGGGLSDPSAQHNSGDDVAPSRFFASTVDTSAVPIPENPKPAYPEDMRRRLVEAHFVVYFEVDTTGRIDLNSVDVPPSVRKPFADAVRTALERWQYRPAVRNGLRVRQLLGQEFIFRIEMQSAWSTAVAVLGPIGRECTLLELTAAPTSANHAACHASTDGT
jgi:TonB family protein